MPLPELAQTITSYRVLDDVMTQWLAGMGALAVGDDPEVALARYIAAKMRSSRERPDGRYPERG